MSIGEIICTNYFVQPEISDQFNTPVMTDSVSVLIFVVYPDPDRIRL